MEEELWAWDPHHKTTLLAYGALSNDVWATKGKKKGEIHTKAFGKANERRDTDSSDSVGKSVHNSDKEENWE